MADIAKNGPRFYNNNIIISGLSWIISYCYVIEILKKYYLLLDFVVLFRVFFLFFENVYECLRQRKFDSTKQDNILECFK